MIFGADMPAAREFTDYAVSPMYGVAGEHGAAVLFLLLTPAVFWLAMRRAETHDGRIRTLVEGYRRLSGTHRLAAWIIGGSAAIHLGLVLGHEAGIWTGAYAAGTGALAFGFFRLLRGGPLRIVRIVLFGSVLAYVVSGLTGTTPDQLGLLTKLAEITALLALTDRFHRGPVVRSLRRVGHVALVVLVGLSGWIGAFQSGAGGHHAGETPAPGVALPLLPDRAATDQEARAAEELYQATLAALAKYADPAVAASDGYQVDGLTGTDFHADNPAYLSDERVFDPERPETLVYADGQGGPVLLGAMFQMSEVGDPGPAVGGPLTVWHAHDHVCFSLLPPGLAGLSDPFGLCPAGAITVPLTNEMIHVWLLPGLEEPFGELDDHVLEDYLAGPGDSHDN